jgi:uncharacterized protein
MHPAIEIAFVTFLTLLWPVYIARIEYPRLRAAIAAGDPRARERGYRSTIIQEWPIAAIAIALWLTAGRPLEALRLTLAQPWRTGLGLAAALFVVAVFAAQRRAIHARPELWPVVRRKFGEAEPLIARTPRELAWWYPVSITAGVCEEILFRGYLTALIALVMPWFLAAVIANLVFGAGHLYLGRTGAIRAGIVGLVLSLLVALTGSLWTAMLLHAAIDIHSGVLGYAAMRAETSSQPAAVAG